jgi:glycosyltransferase involved in cell wall biosynthesis
MNYVSRFEATRVRCDLVAPNAPDEESAKLIERTGGQVFVLRHRNADPMSYIHQLSLIVSERSEQIVHAHGNSATLAFEMMAAKLGGAKIRIPHSHNTTCKMKLADKALRGMFRHNYTDAMACGDAAGEWLFEEKPFTVLHNAIAVEHFHFDGNNRAFARGEYGIPENAFVVCHIGTFNEQKNQRFLIEAFAHLIKSRPESVLMLIGEGDLGPACRERAKALGVEDRVRFVGALADVSAALSAADVFALPSLHEGLPLTLVEAQCAGLPCVVSDLVTRESKLTSLVSFCGIDRAEPFAEALASVQAVDREQASGEAIAEVRAAGYDVTDNAETLVKWYETLIREAKA